MYKYLQWFVTIVYQIIEKFISLDIKYVKIKC